MRFRHGGILRNRTRLTLAVVNTALAVVSTSCVGKIDDLAPLTGEEAGVAGEPPTTAIPRLSRREIEATIADVFGIAGAAERHLPPDPDVAVSPSTLAEEEVFDTLSATKTPNQVFVEGLEGLAFEVARDFTANHAAVDAMAGCTSPGPLDVPCLTQLVETAGLRLWRRPLEAAEVDALVASASPLAEDPAAGASGHYVAARAVIASLIMSPELVYRAEIGAPAGAGIVRLGNHELVARLSYFLWGTTPTAELLALADGPELDDAALGALVDRMLEAPDAEDEIRTFHRSWLRYADLLVTDTALAADMLAESEALIDRALSGEVPWTSLFTSTETFVTPALATHYGLGPISGAAAWVPYDDARAGILSHGSFLSLSSTRVTDTLPSRRGAMLARRILCQTILPPPANVDIDDGVEVAPGTCKSEAYEAHAQGACAGCHEIIDGIGFGFERLDGLGRARTVEEANPSCSIDGAGTVVGKPFSGPRDFVATNAGTVTTCGVENLVRFAGRDRGASDERIARVEEAFAASGHDFRVLMRAIVLDPSFRHRVVQPDEPSQEVAP